MSVRLLERVPVERIEAQARPVDLGRLLLTFFIGVLYLVGFVARKVVLVLGVMLGWAIAATRTGWQDAAVSAEERRRAQAA